MTGNVPRGRIRRTMPVAGFTARAAGGRMVAALREKAGNTGAVERFHERTAEQYAELLGHSKGVLMKAGQLVSMVDANAIGGGELSPYQRALTRLQADAPPMDSALARRVVEDDLGRPISAVFASFSDEPMAAASIGQVHRAVLHDGRDVAVKVQYPGVAQAIRDDLSNTELLATMFRFAAGAASTLGTVLPDVTPIAAEISERISEEIDYRREAAHITAFHELYRDHPFIRVPEVVREASGDRVLTMTYLDGLDWAAAQDVDQNLKDTWAEVITRFIAGAYRHGNLFHADPHPGNYRFGLDGTVGFVDFGCVKVLSEDLRSRIVRMMRSAVDGRRPELRSVMIESGFFTTDSALTADDAYRWYQGIIYEILAPQPVTYTEDTSRRAIANLLDVRDADHLMRHITVPPDLVFFSRLNLSMNAIFTALHATFHARAAVDDMDGVAEPITELGRQHVAWVRERGLPFGTDNHVR
ncbi:ABC1 kinase family protein [Mycobacterium sp. SMC-18]|uniref:ABC1 kinase family protein n=1 Tax=Mycobacteriaceae TaxID=1762 RepID=UPI001BB363EB|nr:MULTISPECIES: AarF/ABC1/UbiB kinase family protein [unclassified Mycolicibacterium]MDX1878523.1 AarF/ABC1/UbiB kinase family protein [Mycolicibacterium sp. 141076]BCI79325.1 putative ABC transporter ATP-binding protein [Mycolicibacterium sp. TY66]BCJ83014.1 putative ABC transporter ATP-binding protein [Mycolicibacterium sp. TY81]